MLEGILIVDAMQDLSQVSDGFMLFPKYHLRIHYVFLAVNATRI